MHQYIAKRHFPRIEVDNSKEVLRELLFNFQFPILNLQLITNDSKKAAGIPKYDLEIGISKFDENWKLQD
ncbi:MAG: hypothetical protein AAB899_03655 [Patescibacteria group bacterium]